nr:MAG TPA: hypothetical protein [Caudoviricetes sp.]
MIRLPSQMPLLLTQYTTAPVLLFYASPFLTTIQRQLENFQKEVYGYYVN